MCPDMLTGNKMAHFEIHTYTHLSIDYYHLISIDIQLYKFSSLEELHRILTCCSDRPHIKAIE